MSQIPASRAPTRGREASLLSEPSPWEADGLQFTVEWRHLGTSALWERVERGWEMPDPLTTFEQADAVARALALRANGERVYRVVDPGGSVLLAYVVQKQLARIDPQTTVMEEIPAGLVVPMVSEVLAHLSSDSPLGITKQEEKEEK